MQKEQQELANLIKGKKVAFIGAGVSHKTLIREFVELGAHVTLCDQKKSVEDFGDYAATIKELGIDLSLGENYLDGFKGQDIIMRTPGFVGYFEKPLQDAMAAGTMVTSEVELFFQFCPCEIVAVTGSDGKTTTTTLISKFYEAAGRKVHLGGNIGAALLPMLPEVAPEDVAVVELSSFQLISMHSSPNIAVVTNVTPNHLDHHKDMQEYIDAKRNILLYQKQPCRAVLGYENEISRSMQKDCKGKQVWFTRLHETDNGAFLREDGMLCMAENGVVTPFLAQKDVKLRGLHNIENLLAAAEAAGVELASCSCSDKCAAGAVNTDCAVCAVNMTECAGVEQKPEPEPEPVAEPDAEPETEKGNAGMLLLVLAVAVLGGGAAFYFKVYRPKQQAATEPEEDYGEELEDYDGEEDGPPWDEDEDENEDTEDGE